jgi:hypothetical protein
MRRRFRRWKEKGIGNWSVLLVIANFTVPVLILYLTIKVLFWRVLELMQPDFYYWLTVVAIVLFVKGVIETAMLARVAGYKVR